jgi:uncharacterized membrane protein YdjX (TVP38/TMEM64 family)
VKYLRIIIIVLILITVGTFIWVTAGSDPEVLLLERLSLADEHLVMIVLLLSAFTLLSTLTGLPILYINLAMGFVLNFVPALLICWGVNIVSVMATFFMVRFFFSDYFLEKYGKKKMITRINKQIGKYGLWAVVFTRGIYVIPTNLINFSFPLSLVSTRSYLLGTTIGLLPECLIGVLSGYLVKHGIFSLTSPETDTWKTLVIGGFIVLFVIVLILLTIRQKRRKL